MSASTAAVTGKPGLEVEGLSHNYGARRIVSELRLTLRPGEVHCLVGPSGCGKTTTLRLIAGLEHIQAGRISIGGRLVAAPGREVAPERRHVGLMFQDFALFPHLTVSENVAFGLAGRERSRRSERVRGLLERVNMHGHARDYPFTLSGGEQQRVALARALAPEPLLMLLDEAFSALDASLRESIRHETSTILRETGTPTLLVTHDAEEAIAVGDRIHVLQGGRIVQAGTPAELYARPLSAFVASFFGAVNRFAGVVRDGRVRLPIGEIRAAGLAETQPAEVIVRPEGVRLGEPGRDGKVLAHIVERRELGPVQVITLALPDGSQVRVRKDARASHAPGQRVEIDLDPSHVFVYPAPA